jgi:transposase
MASAASFSDEIEQLKRKLASRDALIAKLVTEIARLKRWRFGRSAERMGESVAQLQLALEQLQSAVCAEALAMEAAPALKGHDDTAASEPRVVPLRRPARCLPAHLPRETITHAAAHCACPDCGSPLRRLGEDICEVLDFVPGYFKVMRHVRPKLSCRQCARVVQAPAPSRPIERGLASAGLLAQVIVAKYADHTPLYRQQGIYRRAGVELERATLAQWVKQAAKLLAPLADAVSRYVLEAEKLHTDDTPVPVLDPGRGRTKTGRIWTYVRDDRPAGSRAPPAVWYGYSPNRQGQHPREHLKRFTGILQADGYAGYGAIYESSQVLEAACWAHVRRKFYDIHVADRSPIAAEAIGRIGLLYAIEREIRGKPSAERRAVRQERAAPVLDALHAWLNATLLGVSAKSPLAGAIKYALTRWTALTRYCADARIEIDNNTAERSIRPIVLGRRNYLFAGSDGGGESAAHIYTLIGSALLNGIEPYAYLREVLGRIADHPINRIDELLPWRLDLASAPAHQLAA